ncbi:MAG: bifunctional 5,10-methylenetetrahydrofolate dehydrogenase/5,10-methenyltetrahydrofolate cyclohydrolase [Candidatus Bathyarchaeia archaeon]
MAIILNGRETSKAIMEELEEDVQQLKDQGVTPGLALVLTGDDKFSTRYVKMKKNRAEGIGIYTEFHHLEETTQDEILDLIEDLNEDPDIHGIMVQLPLAEGLEELEIVEAIDPEKDVDGLTPTTLGRMLMGEDAYLPAGVEAIMELFRQYELDPAGKHWVVVGSSNFLSKPLLAHLSTLDVEVSFCHEDNPDYPELVKQADVLSTELFTKHAVKADMVKEGVIVIDNGNNYEGKKVYGDVDTDAVKEKAEAITPVPGGVGPMLITMLLKNTIKAATP